MTSVSVEVGIDVAKDWLDVSVSGGKVFRVPNTADGIRGLIAGLSKGSVVHLEASGGYERVPRRLLQGAGLEVRTHDPLRVRRRAQSDSHRGKTDALDARHLSNTGASLKATAPKSPTREALCDLSRSIQTLKRFVSQTKVRAGVPGLEPYVKQALRDTAALVEVRIRKMEKEFAQRVKKTALRTRYELAMSVPGVGPILSRVVTSELPDDLSPFSISQLTSYASVAPIDDSSGKQTKPARIQRGNLHLKAALYMPALGCIQRQKWARELYARLMARGRKHEQAIVAVMRRLLIRILEVLKRGTPWVVKPDEEASVATP